LSDVKDKIDELEECKKLNDDFSNDLLNDLCLARGVLSKLQDNLNKNRDVHNAKNNLENDLDELDKMMNKQDNEINNMFETINSTNSMNHDEKKDIIDELKGKLDGLNDFQVKIEDKLSGIEESAKE